MTDEQAIEILCDFLARTVCPSIQLKRGNDDNMAACDLVHPVVYPVYAPLSECGAPGWERLQQAPSLTVVPKESETVNDTVSMGVRIIITTWDPGERQGDDDERPADAAAAWRAMTHLAERVRRALRSTSHIGGLRVRDQARAGLYAQRDSVPVTWPYSLGWVDITVDYPGYVTHSSAITMLID